MMPLFVGVLVSTEDLLFAAEAASCFNSCMPVACYRTFSSYGNYSAESFWRMSSMTLGVTLLSAEALS